VLILGFTENFLGLSARAQHKALKVRVGSDLEANISNKLNVNSKKVLKAVDETKRICERTSCDAALFSIPQDTQTTPAV